MPRIYYSEEDFTVHTNLFWLHGIVYTLLVAELQGGSGFALPVALWTALLAYHSYWHTPLKDGMQLRTYDRLQQRLGVDWDLAATREEFDHEHHKAEIEMRLTQVLPDSSRIWLAVMGAWVILLFTAANPLPLTLFLNACIGWLAAVLLLMLTLNWRLHDTVRKAHVAKSYRVEPLSLMQTTPTGKSKQRCL